MNFELSPQTIDFLAELISGGSGSQGYGAEPPIGIYRSGPKIEQFMRSCNIDFSVRGSRVPSLVDCLIQLNRSLNEGDKMMRVVEAAADPRTYAREDGQAATVLARLNEFLAYDDLTLTSVGGRMRLSKLGQASPAVSGLSQKAELFDFDTVNRDLDRALKSADSDPEDAVTAACSTIESMCRSVLVELELPLPSKLDLPGLYRAIRDPLGLAPDRTDLPANVADDVRKVLSGLVTSIEGVGSLRTHVGDAHGRERGFRRIDARIARLAIHSASTVALFILETWQHKFPQRQLKRSDVAT